MNSKQETTNTLKRGVDAIHTLLNKEERFGCLSIFVAIIINDIMEDHDYKLILDNETMYRIDLAGDPEDTDSVEEYTMEDAIYVTSSWIEEMLEETEQMKEETEDDEELKLLNTKIQALESNRIIINEAINCLSNK